MKAKIINRYFKKALKKFKKQLNRAAKEYYSEEAIHDLRTSIKRIKAFLKFIKIVDNEFDYDGFYKPWKLLFKKAGENRTYWVAIDKANKILDGKQRDSNQHAVTMNIPVFDGLQSRFNKSFYNKARCRIKNTLRQVSLKKKSEKYLDKRIEKFQGLVNMQIAERTPRLHIIRKILKEFSYNLSFLKKINTREAKFKKLDIWLDETMDLLGDWHDNKVLMAELQKNGHDINYSPQKKKIITEELERENKILLARINYALEHNQVSFTNL